MPITPTYPGLYIEELPFNTHTVTAAPTSIAAFVGYVNPFATKANLFNVAVSLSSFSDYEAIYGGLFTSGLVDASLPRAVFQFFANGGSSAYVVGLEPSFRNATGTPLAKFTDDAVAFAVNLLAAGGTNGLRFAAKQFADQVPMTLIISNLRTAPNTTTPSTTALNLFDVSITYGTTIETYRGVAIGQAATFTPKAAPDEMINAHSTLVTVSQIGGSFGTDLPPIPSGGTSTTIFASPLLVQPPSGVLTGFSKTFSASDFINVLQPTASLDKVEIFNLLLVPGVFDNGVQSAALAFAEHKLAFALLDPPPNATLEGLPTSGIDTFASSMPRSQNGAMYFPWLRSTDPITSQTIEIAPSGFVAGICARTDVARGVWKAPAGLATTILNTIGPVANGIVTDAQHGELNGNQSINCLRQFAAIGTVVFGARTLVGNNPAYAQSRYVPVRRMTLFLEQTLLANLRWVVFEPNDQPLWTAIRMSIEGFMLGLWNQGALQGSTPSAAFQVKCDASTTTPDDQQAGKVNIVVAFAPLKPAEFVIIKIAQLAGQPAA